MTSNPNGGKIIAPPIMQLLGHGSSGCTHVVGELPVDITFTWSVVCPAAFRIRNLLVRLDLFRRRTYVTHYAYVVVAH